MRGGSRRSACARAVARLAAALVLAACAAAPPPVETWSDYTVVCRWEVRHQSIWFGFGSHARPEYVCESVPRPDFSRIRPADPPPRLAPDAQAITIGPEPGPEAPGSDRR